MTLRSQVHYFSLQPNTDIMHNQYRLLSLIVLSLLLFSSCGRRGPVGPQGPAGLDGAEMLPATFEFNVDLISETDFEDYAFVPESIDVIPEDVMLAFVKEGDTNDHLEIWRQLPLTEFTNRGTTVINFDFTEEDIRVFMEANYPLQNTDGYEDLLIRAVHIPAYYVAKMRSNAFDDIQSPYEVGPFLGIEMNHLP